ncbi:MAG: cysteine hydrolase, partial [Burkholderiales bacterium PBB4]
MKQLLIIDPQNDFCDVAGAALPVAGAQADLQRLVRFIQSSKLDAITVTQDSHPAVAVERTSFWRTADGTSPAPFTWVTAADVRSGKLTPHDASLVPSVLTMLERLAERGREGLVIWPVHCVTGSWGHQVLPALVEGLTQWEVTVQQSVRTVMKGAYPLTEHFGVFEADAPEPNEPSTQFNTELARALTEGVDVLFLAGEAGSHCVAASFDQLARYLDGKHTGAARPRVVLLH